MRPKIQTKKSAGADLCSAVSIVVESGQRAVIPTGYLYDVPAASLVKGRSGLAFKHSILTFEGLIDEDFLGQEVRVLIFNTGPNSLVVNIGDRIAQLVVLDIKTQDYFDVVNVERESGFGSTGTNEESQAGHKDGERRKA